MLKRKILAAVAALTMLSLPALAQNQKIYGGESNWAVLEQNNKCLMIKGTETSLAGFDSTRDGNINLIFSLKSDKNLPSPLKIDITLRNVITIMDDRMKDQSEMVFTISGRMGNEWFYKAPVSSAQMQHILQYDIIQFTRIYRDTEGNYGQILVGVPLKYDKRNDRLWKTCIANLR